MSNLNKFKDSNNNTRNKQKSQVESEKNIKYNKRVYRRSIFNDLSGDLQDNPFKFVNELTHGERDVFDALIFFCSRRTHAFPSQATLARNTGLSRVHVNRCISKLTSLGMIERDIYNYDSCEYRVHKFFRQRRIRTLLRPILRNLGIFCFAFLLSQPTKTVQPMDHVTLEKNLTEQLNFSSDYENQQSANSSFSLPVYKKNNRYALGTPMIDGEKYPKTDTEEEILVSIDKILHASVYRQFQTHPPLEFLNNLVEKDIKSMKPILENDPISEAIKSLKFLNLSKWGQIRLTSFADKVIYKARSKFFQSKSTISNPFNHFYALCLIETDRLGLQPDWKKSESLSIIFEEPKDSRMTLSNEKIIPNYTTTKKKKSVPTFYQERVYTKHGKEYRLPDRKIQTADEQTHHFESIKRKTIEPKQELRRSILSGNINIKGLQFLKDTGLHKDIIETVICDMQLEQKSVMLEQSKSLGDKNEICNQRRSNPTL